MFTIQSNEPTQKPKGADHVTPSLVMAHSDSGPVADQVVGFAGRNDSRRPSENAWNIAPSAFCTRRVFAEHAPQSPAIPAGVPTVRSPVAPALSPQEIQ